MNSNNVNYVKNHLNLLNIVYKYKNVEYVCINRIIEIE